MAKAQKLTRSERRERRASVPEEGVYGVDADDAGAGGWIGRYLIWADSPAAAKARIAAAGFHKRRVGYEWTPGDDLPPPEPPPVLVAGFAGWVRARSEDNGWTPWEVLPPDYRHPPQGLARVHPSVR